MSNVSRAEAGRTAQNVTVSFGERFQASAQFDGVFKQGMALVERTAAYLEGPGRVEAKRLPAAVNVPRRWSISAQRVEPGADCRSAPRTKKEKRKRERASFNGPSSSRVCACRLI